MPQAPTSPSRWSRRGGNVLLGAVAERYERVCPGCSLVQFTQSGATYLFDLASAVGAGRRTALWRPRPLRPLLLASATPIRWRLRSESSEATCCRWSASRTGPRIGNSQAGSWAHSSHQADSLFCRAWYGFASFPMAESRLLPQAHRIRPALLPILVRRARPGSAGRPAAASPTLTRR